MIANIVMAGEDIRFAPAVDGWALKGKQIDAYPRIGDFIALDEISDISMLRALWLELYPNIDEGKRFDLPGGFCLVEDGKVLVEPQCCAEFSDVGRWGTLTDFKDPLWSQPYFSNGWIRLWFGHPQLAARQDGGDVWLAPDNDIDRFPVLPLEGASILSVSVATLRRALDESMQVMKVIEARLDQALNGVIPDHLRAAAIDLMLNGCNGRYDELRELDQKPG